MVGQKMSLMKLKRFVVKLKWCIKLLQPIQTIPTNDELIKILEKEATWVPKGHFTVVAGKGDGGHGAELKRFVVELRFLRNPKVLKLLKEAEEEYGFQQDGALIVPCRPQELQKILLEDNL